MQRACESIVELIGPDDETLGTGSVVSELGDVLTCHHVVDGKYNVRVRRAGQTHDSDELIGDLQRDLALVRCPTLRTEPAPVASDRSSWQGASYWTAGYQLQSEALAGALPAAGRVEGTVVVRYAGPTSNYRVNLMTLVGDSYDAGLSGAPVVDVASGAVIGVVTSKFIPSGTVCGFAVPLAPVAGGEERIDQLLDLNRQNIPRFGSDMNRPGGIELCTLQRHNAILGLKSSRVMLSDHLIDRATLYKRFDALVGKEFPIIAITGASGTGKSNLMAQLTMRFPGPAILLRGIDVAVGQRDAFDLLDEAFQKLGVAWEMPSQVLLKRCAPLLLLIDGLNEASALHGGALVPWLASTVAKTRDSGNVLVVSGRPEFWQRAASLLVDPTSLAGRKQTIEVTDYETSDLDAVYASYQLIDANLRAALRMSSIGRNPLFLRFAWELGAQADVEAGSVPALLARFVEMKCERVALVTGRSVPLVTTLLEKAMGQISRSESMWLDRPSFFGCFGVESQIAEALVEESLFTPAHDGYTITFDPVGEYLQSREVQPAAADEIGDLKSQVDIGVQHFAVLRAEQEGRYDDVAAWLDAASEAAAGQHSPLAALGDVIERLAEPSRFLPQIRAVFGRHVRNGSYRVSSFAEFTMYRAGLTDTERLDLLQVLAASEWNYGWRVKDWRDARPRMMVGRDATIFVRALTELVERDSVLVQLVDWLDDETSLAAERIGSHEAVVADVASAYLLWNIRHDFDRVCEVLASRADTRAVELLVMITKIYPNEISPVLARWSSDSMSKNHYIVMRCLNEAVRQSTPNVPEAWIEILGALCYSPHKLIAFQALTQFVAMRPDDVELARRTISQFAELRTSLSPGVLSPLVVPYPEMVLNVLELELDGYADPDRIEAALRTVHPLLSRPVLGQRVVNYAVRSLDRLGPGAPVLAIAGLLEDCVAAWYADAQHAMFPEPWVVNAVLNRKWKLRRDLIARLLYRDVEHSAGQHLQARVAEAIAVDGDEKARLWAFIALGERRTTLRTERALRILEYMPGVARERAILALIIFSRDTASRLMPQRSAPAIEQSIVLARLAHLFNVTRDLDIAIQRLVTETKDNYLRWAHWHHDDDGTPYAIGQLDEARASGHLDDIVVALDGLLCDEELPWR